jgi:hypothetical protein
MDPFLILALLERNRNGGAAIPRRELKGISVGDATLDFGLHAPVR